MSDDPDKTTTPADDAVEAAEARGAELRENVALADARRAEEEHAKAEQEVERARKKAEELAEKERLGKEKAERMHAEADKARVEAPAAPAAAPAPPPESAAAGLPGADRLPEAAQRPEVLVGAAFVGAFLVARILKRIFD